MAEKIEVEFTSNKKEYLSALEMVAKEVLTKWGEVGSSAARELSPVDTGRLRNSITYDVDEDDKSVVIGTNVEYAPYLELGTGIYAEGGGGRQDAWHYKDSKGNWHSTRGMKPKPYLRPAIQNNIDYFNRILEQELKNPT